ncbi:hypothetical protein [Methanosarcina acetivorans]|uniref:hypothetical protein n=1 Tax=Methanosarcina acetivorans TaxID=2214 RepID=UPI0012FF1DA0|nr:hypothetical protein [Methanosarcina acetivorans]
MYRNPWHNFSSHDSVLVVCRGIDCVEFQLFGCRSVDDVVLGACSCPYRIPEGNFFRSGRAEE